MLPQHLTNGFPGLVAGQVQVATPLLLVQIAPIPHKFGWLSQGSSKK
jgi:hypothetical protein